MKSIAVFCGSSLGNNTNFVREAKALGQFLAKSEIQLVYGGAQVGLMGAIADGILSQGGKVIGVIPEFLQAKEIAHEQLTDLITVKTMHERKAKMNELSDGFIALPGGFGTVEELFEILTWAQLGLHTKPIGILNTDGYFEHMLLFIEKMIDSELLKLSCRDIILVGSTSENIVYQMCHYRPPKVDKWIQENEI